MGWKERSTVVPARAPAYGHQLSRGMVIREAGDHSRGGLGQRGFQLGRLALPLWTFPNEASKVFAARSALAPSLRGLSVLFSFDGVVVVLQ